MGCRCFPTIASQFNDAGVNRLFAALCQRLEAEPVGGKSWKLAGHHIDELPRRDPVIPGERVRYLAEIAADGRNVRETIERQARAASRAQSLREALEALRDAALPKALEPFADADINDASDASRAALRARVQPGARGSRHRRRRAPEALAGARAGRDRRGVSIPGPRARRSRGENYSETLSHQKIPKIAVPKLHDWGDLLTFLMKENLPGAYPYTAGVYPYRREEEDPTRMFAGEGMPERTNRRFHYLAGGHDGDAPVDGVRFDDALRRGSRRAAGHLRAHRQFGRLDRDARRHEEACIRASTCARRAPPSR